MTEPSIYDLMTKYSRDLKLDFDGKELAAFALENKYTDSQLKAVIGLLKCIDEKKHTTAINTLLRLSRLPRKVPKTFESYDFSRIHGKDVGALKALSSLAEVNAGKNIALIGPPGVGKTHLAQAYGRACCLNGMKTYFLKASELREKFNTARRFGREERIVATLVKPTCLIIDEVGRCTFDKENTTLFFDLVDRRYSKEGPQTIIFTSNNLPATNSPVPGAITLLGKMTFLRHLTVSLMMPAFLISRAPAIAGENVIRTR